MLKKAKHFAAHKNDPLRNPDEDHLTIADVEAWWEYIRRYLPDNYKLAKALKGGVYDPILQMQCDNDIFNYNDYFDIYGLPRVRTVNHEILVNNTSKLQIADNESYLKAKNIFKVAHFDDRFHEWKIYQYAYSQNGKCAWCQRNIEYDKTEVDHIQPLAFKGKNVSWNLVVACEHCNGKKYIDTNGWNDECDGTKKNQKPSWIKENKKDVLWRDILEEARKKIANANGKPRYNKRSH
jgi:5-methylcytosine-specific restriction endonuclease McrA